MTPPRRIESNGIWVNRWDINSLTSDSVYVVGQKTDGSWGCSCPHWKFAKAPKPDCKHIIGVKKAETQTFTPANIPVLPVAAKLKPFGFTETERKRAEARQPVAATPVFLLQTRRQITLED